MMEKRMIDTTWKMERGRPVYVAREQLPIPFFDHAVLAVRRDDGKIYLRIRDMCEALELAFTAQRRRKVCT
jgi:prophage antirepressor-like protein